MATGPYELNIFIALFITFKPGQYCHKYVNKTKGITEHINV